MHPEILRELNAQRGRELRERAHRARLAKMARRSRQHGRDLPDDDFVIPAIPDYVDGSFRTDRVAGDVTSQVTSETGQAPAGHAA
jgi:hypothetical protein